MAKSKGEEPHVVEPKQVVGMFVREQHRMHQADAFAQQLGTQVGRGVNEQIAERQSQKDRAAGALVPRIDALADGTTAADGRHPHAGAGSEEDQLAADVRRDERIWQGDLVGRESRGGRMGERKGGGRDPENGKSGNGLF